MQDLPKIVITGPEATGKSQLAAALGRHFGTVWVPEYARTYLAGLSHPYTEADLLAIAQGQVAWEDDLYGQATGLLVCDTGMLVMKIWSSYKYGRCHPWIEEQWQNRRYTGYLLLSPDLPWAADPLRENPHDREVLFGLYETALVDAKKKYAIITGLGAEREQQAIAQVEAWLHPTAANE